MYNCGLKDYAVSSLIENWIQIKFIDYMGWNEIGQYTKKRQVIWLMSVNVKMLFCWQDYVLFPERLKNE